MNTGTYEGLFVISRKLWYVIFWVLTTVSFISIYLGLGFSLQYVLLPKLFFLPFQIIAAHVVINFIFERTLYQGKYIALIFWSIIFAYLLSLFVYFVHDNIFIPYIKSDFVSKPFMEMVVDWKGLITYYFFWIFFLTWILSCIEIIYRQFRINEDAERLLQEKNKSELLYLKTKFHPLFILSTLRNLEKLTAKKSDLSTFVVEKLSNVLDYILYKGSQESILLADELEIINDYLSLEKIRLEKKCNIQFVYDELDCIKFIPMVFFSFVESNFREYDIETLPYGNCKITLTVQQGKITMIIQNYDFIINDILLHSIDEIEKQLRLLYKGNYHVDQNIKNGKQILTLIIDYD